VVVDHEGRWLASNPAATTLLGIGLAVPDRDVLALLANHVTTADGGKIGREDLAVALLHADRDSGGTIGPVQLDGSRWLRISATPIRSRKEHPLAVSLRLHDVTISQRAEAALRNNRDELERQVALRTREIEVAVVSLQTEVDERQLAERKLRKSEERHRAISEVSTDLSFAFRLERDGRLEWDWVSRSVEPLTGYKTSELAPLGWQQIVHPDDLENVFEQRSRLLECRPIEFEFRLLTQKGDTRWDEAHVRGARDEPDSTMRAVGAVRDITARRQATEQLRKLEMQKHESERLESLGVLAGGIAHDFNNLLAVIGGNAALAASELSSPEALEKRLERIRSAADYAVALTDQILTYAGKPSLIVSPLDLGNLIASLLDLLRASISSKCRIEMQLCDDLPAIDGDSTQIRQIIMNLVTNASEAFGENEGRILLRTGTMNAHPDYLGDAHGAAARQPGEYVYFEVIDNGRGIDADSRKRIFEPFFSTKFSGRGLGLAAVHGIVQAHGGVIKLTSEPGWGTAFRVLFPKSHQKLVYRSTVTLETGASTAGDAAGATVLVVDDDEAVREIAQAFLERAEFRVLVAGGGIEALELIRDRGDEIDAVVLDLSMPDVDGEQTYRELRRDRPDLPVVLVSGYSEEMAAASFSDTDGAAAFLSKPYMPEVLIERIRAALTR
ncbi:MAG: ATP-binding protein, partial [Myxococcota bacterium]